ncbi:MAG TPA: DUF2848 domain-containing protein [Inquilinus sp.]|nr:DUF2848 domain-containing protein [Inquilinus sp.]
MDQPTIREIGLAELCPGGTAEVVIAGWAGRDAAAVRHHIEELAALGVPPPSRTPVFYRVAADRLTQTGEITVLGRHTSGEVEPVLVWAAGELYVGVGSDHTDRDAERAGVALSKQLCPKVLGRGFWRYADVAGRWDDLVLRAEVEVDGTTRLYQEGPLAALLPADRLIELCRAGGSGSLADGSVMFCGTVPALGGIARSDAFRMALHDPASGTSLTHAYRIHELPVVA